MSSSNTNNLEWLRTIRREIQAEIGTEPGARAAYYQAKEKKLRSRLHPGHAAAIAAK